MDGISTLPDEEIEEKKKQIAELDTRQKEIEAKSENDRAKQEWIDTDATLTQKVAEAEENLKKATEIIESEAFKMKETLIKEWNATIDARLWMTEANRANKAKTDLKKELEELETDFADIIGGRIYAENEAKGIAKEIETIDKYLVGENEKTSVYENAQTIVGFLKTIMASRKAIAKHNSEMEQENMSLEKVLVPALEKAEKENSSENKALEEKETEVRRQEDEVTALNLQELRKQLETINELLRNIRTAKERVDSLASAKQQMETKRQDLVVRLEAINEKKKQLAEMNAPIHDAEIKMNVRKEDLDKQKDTVDKFASTLRLKLQIGDTCPVCRQKIENNLPHEEELSALVGGLRNAYDEAEEEYKRLVNEKTRLETETRTESKTYGRDIKALDEDRTVVVAEEKALEACKVCGIEMLDDTTLPKLETLKTRNNKLKVELTTKINEGDTKETRVKNLRKELDKKRKSVKSSENKRNEAHNAVEACRGRINTKVILINTKKGEMEKAELMVSQLVVGHWDVDWNESPKAFCDILTQATNTYKANNQKKQVLTSRLTTVNTNIQNVNSVMGTILAAIPAWNDIRATEASPVDNLLDKANGINNKVAKTLTQLNSAENSYMENKTHLDKFLIENTPMTIERLKFLNTHTYNDINIKDGELKTKRDAVVAKKTLLVDAKDLLKAHQQKKPELTEEDVLDKLIKRIEEYKKQLVEMSERKGSINQELKTDARYKQQLGMLIQAAADKKMVYQKWSRLNQLIGSATGSTFRKIAQSYVLTNLIHSANCYMRTLTDRYTLKVNPGTFVISIEDAYQGFVSRAASTISGGESFLVSLSLALALSDIGREWQVDTLFIDEGFGTLSGEPLQKAIDTLRSLHSKTGRHVGIISHVEELQEQIPVQIQVIQEGHNSSSTIRIIP